MGESIVDSSSFEDKKQIAKTASSSAALEVSVSFGRFENDSLSWERFSTFSPNKYLEEVEKCATPGSVAEKKAYFEAHYKKIAARKAELMDQEKSQDSAEEEPNWVSEESNIHIDEEDGDALLVRECQSPVAEVEDESDGRAESPKLGGSEKIGIIGEEATEVLHIIESRDTKDECKDTKGLPQNLEEETVNVKKTKDENVKSDRPKASHKITTVSKKKPASPITKTPQVSTPRASKPAPIRAQQVSTPTVSKSASARMSKPAPTRTTPQFSTPRVSKPAPIKKENGTSVPRKKSPSVGEAKRLTPKSLHMSLRVDHATTPVRSDPAPLTTARKSLIMERMGDKDIVKRAFKSFQNNFNQRRSFSEERSPVLEQASTTGTGCVNVSETTNMRKENGGTIKVSGTEKRSAKAAPSSLGLKSNERAPKHKEFSKKLEEKSNIQAERTRVQPKSKEQKEAEIKRMTRSLDLKARPMSGSYPGKKMSTGPSH